MLPQASRSSRWGRATGCRTKRALISTDDKVRFIDLLSETGLTWIEATSFVSPKAIPQLADAAEVFARIRKAPGVRYPVLVPNLKGFERARAAGADAIAVFTAASEAFTQAQHQHDDRRVARDVRRCRARGASATACGCAATFRPRSARPFEGDVDAADGASTSASS